MESLKRILPIKPKLQILDHSCGPASITMVLGALGIHIPEKRVIEQMHLPTRGASWKRMIEVAKSFGIEPRFYQHASLQRLKSGLTIVCFQSDYQGDGRFESHYSPVVGVGREYITLADPAIGRRRKIPLDNFVEELWYDDETSKAALVF